MKHEHVTALTFIVDYITEYSIRESKSSRRVENGRIIIASSGLGKDVRSWRKEVNKHKNEELQ